jgi:nucleoside-diphosphate-sugar epimerase
MTAIAVTGCASRFAQALLPLLEADASVERIVGLDVVAPQLQYAKLEFAQRDVRDPNFIDLVRGCDALVHLAFVVGRPYATPLHEAADINLRGTWNACEAAAQAGVRKLVISSSIAAYGILPDNPVPLTEEHFLRGLYTDFYYSQHKHANEIWLDGLQLRYPALVISRLRPCIVMGPRQWAAMTAQVQGESYLATAGARERRVQYVHEDDLAAAFHLMLQRDLPGAYNVVGDGSDSTPHMAELSGLTVIEVEEELFQQGALEAWKTGLIPFGPEWTTGGEGSLLCANDKLKAAGWAPRYTSAEAFAATVHASRT